MEIVKNIENARSKRRPKPSKKVLENLKDQKKEKDQKNPKDKKKESPKATRQSPRIKCWSILWFLSVIETIDNRLTIMVFITCSTNWCILWSLTLVETIRDRFLYVLVLYKR